ncbi:hypothetical protein N7462_010125 [Penicillium macrosclerotiorum]|uniref:uncharacterized protein n=1 Tax=Penicillium macrosclerotiorum TaxID=303699 RepID=UPI002547773C|nr:uncharacterized protein N7462_010125 [Penicillium macrosclerotiorum]KAJ5669055.1 hypothetical protein N7462_010125 [Penicillium macrosclerotiorum]
MGGIPWQSKGCRTCKRRKIKCDRQEPECGRCIKRGLKCEGYDGNRIFVHDATVKPRGSNNVGSYVKGVQIPPVDWVIPQVVTSGPALREQVFSSYIDIFFPNQEAHSSVDLWHYLISGISALPQKSTMLQKAVSAISCAYLGKLNNDDRIFQYGIQLYNIAIRHMSSMISRDAYSDDIIYTTVIFQELETCYCPHGLQAWVAHIAGTNAILSHYRHRADRSPLVNAIYHEYQKLRIVFSAKGINMSQEDYEYVTQPSEGNPVVELLSLFAGFAPLAVAINKADPADHEGCKSLLQKCLGHKKKLLAWSSENLQTGPVSCARGEVLCSQLPPADHMFGAPYRFLSLDNARLHTMFWTLASIIHPLISQIRSLVKAYETSEYIPSSPIAGGMLDDEDYLLSGFYADQIGRAIPYCVQDKMKSWGVHTVIFSLCQLCKIAVDRGSMEQFDWCQRAFKLMADRGFDSAARLSEVFWGMWSVRSAMVTPPTPAQELQPKIPSVTEGSESPGVSGTLSVAEEQSFGGTVVEVT